jgi:hypothetical protein
MILLTNFSLHNRKTVTAGKNVKLTITVANNFDFASAVNPAKANGCQYNRKQQTYTGINKG